jgi:hypothetical protein
LSWVTGSAAAITATKDSTTATASTATASTGTAAVLTSCRQVLHYWYFTHLLSSSTSLLVLHSPPVVVFGWYVCPEAPADRRRYSIDAVEYLRGWRCGWDGVVGGVVGGKASNSFVDGIDVVRLFNAVGAMIQLTSALATRTASCRAPAALVLGPSACR